MFPQTDLQTFAQVVPVCCAEAPLETLRLVFFQEKCEQVVIVNSENHPLGLVSLHQLLPYLLNSSRLNWGEPLSTANPGLISPLRLIPTQIKLETLGLYLQQTDLQSEPIPPLALVNDNGELIGLINNLQILDYLTQQSLSFSRRQPPRPTLKDALASARLIDFLDELPIPLMVQTEDSTLVHQNSAWQSLIGTSPEEVQEVAASVTRWTFPTSASVAVPNSTSLSSVESSAVPLRNRGSSRFSEPVSEETTALQMPSWCQLGNQPDTYICVCPMPNNQERVWQFTRQRLNSEYQTPSLWATDPELTRVFNRSVWLVLAQDITEQHRVSQELTAKNADLIQLNRLKDEFLACISHELKTPLTAVLGLSSLLKDQMLGELNDRQARYAALIHKSGRHLMLVVNDILDLTRIETGQLELTPEPVQIRAVCERAFEIALQQHQEQDKSEALPTTDPLTATKPRFKLDIETGLESFVADELRLRQMLINLICNALKFTPNRSGFGLKVSRWENWIAFTVWDKGIGIPEDKQHLIFQKFQQLESPLTRKFEGTGLGLVLTQRLARLHGGDVSFISKPEKGSQFTLLLPPRPPSVNWEFNENTTEQRPELLYPPTRSNSTSQSRLVLVVEAVPQFIQTLSNQLTHLGYRVVIARSGTEAVEKARRLQPKVILLNPLLPLLSGWDVLTLLKTDSQTYQIPVIVTATLADKQRAMVNRCDGFLNLPVHALDLEKVLAELIPEPSLTPPEPLMILWLSLNEGSASLTQESENFVYSSAEDLEAGFIPPSIYRSALFLPHFSHCRILEADDLNQALMIAQIWHPNVIVLERHASVENPLTFLNKLSEKDSLARLPIVTLDSVTTQVANQIKNLSIFPCLTNTSEANQTAQDAFMQTGTALLEVIQIATRLSWKPNILVIDSSLLPKKPQGNELKITSGTAENNISPSSPEFNPKSKSSNPRKPSTVKLENQEDNDVNSKLDQALLQYIEIAGFRSIMGQSWPEILQQIQCQSIDLILICLREKSYIHLVDSLHSIELMLKKIPIIVLPHSPLKLSLKPEKSLKSKKETGTELQGFTAPEIQTYLQTLNSSLRLKIMPNHTSGEQLLEQIKILLTQVKA